MPDSQEMPVEQQQAANQQESNVQATNQQEPAPTPQAVSATQAANNKGQQQASALAQPSPEARIAEIAAQLAHTRITELQDRISQLEAQEAQLQAQLAQARKEAEDYRNQYMRTQADADNIRKRQDRQIADRLLQLKKNLFKQILEVMDNVERALVYQETMDKQELQQILRMLLWQMGEVLRGEGLNPVAAVGEAFNPYIHEAVEAVENSDQPDGTILEELRKGYMLGDETLRPARVKVSVGK